MKLSEYVSDFSKVNVLVIGDLMLDKYIWGSVDRISPEAPVQVVNVKKESYAPGGASNVAHNLAALSGNVFLVGLVGKDDTNGKLLSMLKEKKINTEGVIYDENKPTTQKMRIIAHNQQLLRVDYEDKEYINEDDEKLIIEYVEKMIDKIDVIVVSDYAKGLITKSLVEKLVSVAKDKKIIVDPKPKHFEYYKGASLITPNHKEACEMLSLDVKNSGLEDVGKKISEKGPLRESY